MQSRNSIATIAAAGSGKTTYLVKEALATPDRRIAFLTYTNNNFNVIHRIFARENGVTPSRVDVLTWFVFLLHECARPYQRSAYTDKRICGICFPKGRSPLYVPQSDIRRYYFAGDEEAYADKISRFVIECERRTGGLVTARLRSLYDAIFVDELQDLAGYDLDLLDVFMRSGIPMHLVGDPRQSTYATNNAAKNSRFRKQGLMEKIRNWESAALCQVERQSRSFRCNQAICDFADGLWPDWHTTKSHNMEVTGHDGVFRVYKANLHDYIREYTPVVLRYNGKTDNHGYPSLNFGGAKGMTFDRVLILPHGPVERFLKTANRDDVLGSIEKLYVAITRAKHSVAFLYDGQCAASCLDWKPRNVS